VTELSTLLLELEETWRRKGFDQGGCLAPGLPPEDIVCLLASEGLPAPTEVVDWFSWRNGAIGSTYPPGVTVELVPARFEPGSLAGCLGAEFGRGYRLELAKRLANEFRERGETGETSTPDFWWRTNWLPLMFSNTDVLAVDLSSGTDSVNVLAIADDADAFWVPRTDSLADFVRLLLSIPDRLWQFSTLENRWRVDLRALSLSKQNAGGLLDLLTA
jgi:hypothetical protein